MKKLVIIILSFISFSLLADDLQHYNDIFIKGNQLYTEEKFEEAKNEYEKILANDVESSELYYNLGNCYYKLKSYPLSILFYEKALKLYPENDDVKFNLEIANQHITDKIESLPSSIFSEWIKKFTQLLTIETWAKLSLFSAALVLLFAAGYMFSNTQTMKKISFYTSILWVLLVIVSISSGYMAKNNSLNSNQGIVFTSSLNVKSAPAQNSTTLFVIHEGAKIKVLQTNNNWIEISLQNGNVGWIEKQHILNI